MQQYKHLSENEREIIEAMLKESASLMSISRHLDRHCYTISKEIRRHLHFVKSGCHGSPFNDCLNRKDCTNAKLCDAPDCTARLCHTCQRCSKYCVDYEKEYCDRLDLPPYVCNGCPNRRKCTLEKRFYSAKYAQEEYQQTKHDAGSGITLSPDELQKLDDFISPLIKKGQSIQHILSNNPTTISLSARTIYNYIDAGLLSARNIDLPRKVRYRSHRKSSPFIDKSYRIGRTYEDYIHFQRSKPGSTLVELDTVIGKKGGKVLLTIHFVESQLMLAYLRNRNTAVSVTKIFNQLYQQLKPEIFKKLFPVLLTDNGNEFSDPYSLEHDSENNTRTHVFYCKALAPYQKGAAENNHEFIRRVLPKGSSFDHLSQQNIDLMMNHINSYSRANLGNKSPYEIFCHVHGKKILDILNITAIPPNDIILRPELLPIK